MLDRIYDLNKIQNAINSFSDSTKKEYYDYLNNPLDFGDTKIFNETLQQLSILTFKNMKKYFNKDKKN